eukprot:COSAG01_NODE_1473_length_10193_cov_13.155736_2_plen_159_part_00
MCCSDPSVFSTGGGGGVAGGGVPEGVVCGRGGGGGGRCDWKSPMCAPCSCKHGWWRGCGRGREVQVIKDGWDDSDVMADALLTEGLIIVAVVEPREPKSGAQDSAAHGCHACMLGWRPPARLFDRRRCSRPDPPMRRLQWMAGAQRPCCCTTGELHSR